MSPLDRIAQLSAELAAAREQAARDSATIARLGADKAELMAAVKWAEYNMQYAGDPAIREATKRCRSALAKTEGVTP